MALWACNYLQCAKDCTFHSFHSFPFHSNGRRCNPCGPFLSFPFSLEKGRMKGRSTRNVGNNYQFDCTSKNLQVGVNMKKNAKGRRTGEEHQNAVLTNDEVELVRQCREVMAMTYAQIAEKFEISKSSVAKICQYARR